MKEFGGAADLSHGAEHITSGDDDLALMVGVDTAVFHGYVNCGAVGAITGVGNALPREVLYLIRLCEAAARRRARELEEALMVLSSFDEGPNLVLHYKHLMVLNGDEEYTLHFNPSDGLNDARRGYAEAQYALFRARYAEWAA